MTQELIPVKPSADWGLTRGGAHCQWLWGCLAWSLVLTKSAPRQLPAFNRRQPQIAAASASGLRYRAPFYSWFVATASWQSSASNGANGRSWGGLSRRRRAPRRRPEFGHLRVGVVVLGRGSWWVLRAPGEVWSTVVCPALSHGGSGHDGDGARRRRALGSAGSNG